MTIVSDPILSTGSAARSLGVSRQHLVDLCDRGDLAYFRVGKHRRIRKRDLDQFISSQRTAATGTLTRKDRRSLALHCLVAAAFLTEPEAVRVKARTNLVTIRAANPDGSADALINEWEALLDGRDESLIAALVGLDEHAHDLRNVTPFAGVISQDARDAIYSRRHS